MAAIDFQGIQIINQLREEKEEVIEGKDLKDHQDQQIKMYIKKQGGGNSSYFL